MAADFEAMEQRGGGMGAVCWLLGTLGLAGICVFIWAVLKWAAMFANVAPR